MTGPKPTSGAKGAASQAAPVDDPSEQLVTAQGELNKLVSQAQSTDQAKATITNRIKVLKDRSDFEKGLPDFVAWTRDRANRIASAKIAQTSVQEALSAVADATKLEAISTAIAHQDANISSLSKTAAAAQADAVAKTQKLADLTVVLQAKTADVAKAKAALATVDDQLKALDAMTKAASDALGKPDKSEAILALVDAQNAAKLELPTRESVIATLRTCWTALDAAQADVDAATADKAAATAAAADQASKLKAAQQTRQATALQAIKDALQPPAT